MPFVSGPALTEAFGIWHLAFGIWHMAFGIWHLAFGIWHLALAFGIWHLTVARHFFRRLKISQSLVGLWPIL
jgi:hypothetical protein